MGKGGVSAGGVMVGKPALGKFYQGVPISWLTYWTNLYGQSDLNLWIKSRNGLSLVDSINPANNAAIRLAHYKKASISSYAHVTDNGALDVGATDFTFWMRVKSETATTTKQLLGGKYIDVGTAPNGYYGFGLNATTNTINAVIQPTGGFKYVTSVATFNSLGWCTLRLDINFTSMKFRFFINNVQIGSDTAFTGTFPALDNKYRFMIGSGMRTDNGATTSAALSAHSDTFILNRLLTPTEAANAELGIIPTNCKAHWPCSNARCLHDVSGNGYHMTVEGVYGTNMTEGYDASSSLQSLKKGYALYKKLPTKPVYFFVPNLASGSAISTPPVPTGFVIDKSIAASSETNFNLPDAVVRFAAGSVFDRSNTTIWSDKARAATTFYDSGNVTDWHTTELLQDNLDNWANDDYKDVGFVKISSGILSEVFSYNTVKSGSNLKKVLYYTGDYSTMFTHFTRTGAGVLSLTTNHPNAQYYNGKTYIVYQGDDDDPYIITYTHATGAWSGAVKIGVNPLDNGDAHGYPSMLVDSTGYIHVFWGAHVSDVSYSKSTNPEDITAWTAMTSPNDPAGSDGDYGTYYQPIQLSNGTIFLFFRHKNQTQGDWWGYKTSTNGGVSWSAYTDLFREFAYWRFIKGVGDVIYATGEGYMTSGYDKPHIYYAKYEGGKWYKSDGTELSPPVVQSVTDLKIYDSGTKVIVMTICAVDSENEPYIAFAEGDDNTGVCDHTFCLLKKVDGVWTKKTIGATTRMNNNGVPALIIKAGGVMEYYLISSKQETYIGGNLEKWISSDNGDTFTFDSIVIYGNVIIPSAVLNYHNNAKIMVGDYMSTITEWVNKGYLLGDSGLIKNYKGSNW